MICEDCQFNSATHLNPQRNAYLCDECCGCGQQDEIFVSITLNPRMIGAEDYKRMLDAAEALLIEVIGRPYVHRN